MMHERLEKIDKRIREDIQEAFDVSVSNRGDMIAADHVTYEFDRKRGIVWRNEIEITGDIMGRVIARGVDDFIAHVFPDVPSILYAIRFNNGKRIRGYISMPKAV